MERNVDLICGMEIDPKNAPFESIADGRSYYFCSAQCKDKFEGDLQAYIQNFAEPTPTS